MTPLLTSADLKAHPTAELRAFLDTAQAASKASESTVRKDVVCRDGTLVVTSHNGGPVMFTVEPPAQQIPGE